MKSNLNVLFATFLSLGFIVSAFAGPTVTQIAAGSGFALFLKSDGSLWTAGYNFDGETGNPSTYGHGFPYQISFPIQIVSNGVTAITAGGQCSLFIKTDGSLWGMGDDLYGQLGLMPFLSNTNVPEMIIGSNVVAVSTGSAHTIFRSYFVTGSGVNQTITMQVRGMGEDNVGQLGNYSTKTGNSNPSSIAIEFDSTKFFPAITPVCAGGDSSFFIKTDGTLWAMGANAAGQLGDGTTNLPPTAEQVPGASNVTAVATSASHTLFVESDGSLWTMGINTSGEGGNGTTNVAYYSTPQKIVGSNVVAVSAALYQSLFLKSDGTLWGMGFNGFGELGSSNVNHTYPSPRQITTNVVNFAAGGGITYYTKTDGTTWAIGVDTYGQLGDGFADDIATNALQIFPYPSPVFTSVKFIPPHSVQLNATCPVGGSYYLLTTTDLTQPMNAWGGILSTNVSTRGPTNFVCTIDIGAPNQGAPRTYYALMKL